MNSMLLLLPLIFMLYNQTSHESRTFNYSIQYHQNEFNITTNETISLTLTGNAWSKAPDQKEAIWLYHTKSKTKLLFKNQFSLGWLTTDTTGIIENDKKMWLHPPRNNQYSLTETAAFPDVRKNKKAGDTYSSITFMGAGLGPWQGKKVKCSYTVIRIDAEKQDSVWTIQATSEFEEKKNNSEFIYSSKRGFISISYIFFNGDSMTMKQKIQKEATH